MTENLQPELIEPRRKKLKIFLEEKQHYNPTAILERINESWMIDEKIILLVKKKLYDEAIEMYVIKKQFNEAEEFCNQRANLALMTNLFCIYIKKFNFHTEMNEKMKKDKKTSNEMLQEKKEAELYKR